ncbi:BAR/IMD domain-containing adapter protein 2-like 2 [Mustelus asterias]
MALSADQIYRSTLNTYQNITDQFNPGLQNLVFLGSNFVKAFRMLATAANVYFVAVGRFGEQALQTSTSQTLGQVLLQMTDTQRQLSNDLEVIFRRFNDELLREMDRNMELDVEYITDSKRRFEMEHRKRTEVLGGANAELRRLERMRSTQARDMQEKIYNLESNMEVFLKSSYRQALAEERRRYRFLAEKHFHLSYQFLSFYNKAQETLHNKVPGWKEHTSPVTSGNRSGRASPRASSTGMALSPNEDIISRCSYIASPQPVRRELNGAELISYPHSNHRQTEERDPSMRSGSDGHLSRSGSLGDKINAMNSPRVQAIASHSAGSNQTMLSFGKGDIIAILVPEAKNGWLYGKLEGTPKQGWFPCSFVRPLEEEIRRREPSARMYPLRSSRSAEDLLDAKDYMLPPADYSSSKATSVPPAPPLPSGISTRSQSPAPPNLGSRRNSATSLAVSESGRSRILSGADSQLELFPRGTNPFATVKLKPTVTNDRSKPFVRLSDGPHPRNSDTPLGDSSCQLGVLAISVYTNWPYSTFKELCVPGPPPTLFLGSIPYIWRKDLHVVDVECYNAFGNIWGLYLGRQAVLVLTDTEIIHNVFIEDNCEIFHNPKAGQSQYPFSESFFQPDDDDWKRYHLLLTPAFAPTQLKQIFPLVVTNADDLVQCFGKFCRESSPVTVRELFTQYVRNVLMMSVFDLDTRRDDASHTFLHYWDLLLQAHTRYSTISVTCG